MQQVCLNNLAIMSIKSEFSRGLNMNTVLKDFAEKKARKVFFFIINQNYDMIQLTFINLK